MSRLANCATRVSAGNPAECHLLGRTGREADRPPDSAHCRLCRDCRVAGGLPERNARRPGCGRLRTAPPASGPAARPASAAPVFPPAASAAGLAVAPSAAAGGAWWQHRRSGADQLPAAASAGVWRVVRKRADRRLRGQRSRPSASPHALREDCDGNDLGGAACANLGFPSGTLRCDPTTCVSTGGAGCSECVPMAPSVVSCGPFPPVAAPYISELRHRRHRH